MITIQSSSTDARILQYLLVKYPVTIIELKDMLSLPSKKINLAIGRLVKRKMVELDVLPDKTYVRLIRRDIRFEGINPSQKQALKKRNPRKRKLKKGDEESAFMYG